MAALELIQVRQFPGAESSIHLKNFSCRASSITEGSYLENFDCRISFKESLFEELQLQNFFFNRRILPAKFQHLKMNCTISRVSIETLQFRSFN